MLSVNLWKCKRQVKLLKRYIAKQKKITRNSDKKDAEKYNAKNEKKTKHAKDTQKIHRVKNAQSAQRFEKVYE